MNAKTGRGRFKKEPKESRNQAILKAATVMFASRGYAETDIQELASELGIGKGTIYRAFASKQELFCAALNRSLEEMTAYVRNEADSHNVEGIPRLQVAVKEFLRFFDTHPDVMELFIQERAAFPGCSKSLFWEHFRKTSSRWEVFFSDLMEKGLVRKIDPRWLSDTLNQLLYGQLFLHRLDDTQQSLESRGANILTIFFVGVLTKDALLTTTALSIDLEPVTNE